jgi:hypothetical protein
VAQRHEHLWLKIVIGVAVALAIADVLALILVVAPLRVSQHARANTADLTAQLTRSTVDQSLILPTRDPRKPLVTRTPLPTITPWLIPTATPAPTATPMPAAASAPGLAPAVPDAAASPVLRCGSSGPLGKHCNDDSHIAIVEIGTRMFPDTQRQVTITLNNEHLLLWIRGFPPSSCGKSDIRARGLGVYKTQYW